MERELYKRYTDLLCYELTVAMGCTEPIAIAYAGAQFRRILGKVPEHFTVYCSGNIVKNVMGVTVPNSGGKRGIPIAAALGVIGGNADDVLNVLQSVGENEIIEADQLLQEERCSVELIPDVENLYIRIEGTAGEDSALVELRNYHSNITRAEKNGTSVLKSLPEEQLRAVPGKEFLNLRDILEYAENVPLGDIAPVLEKQLSCNVAIAEEGLHGNWGAQVGKTIIENSSQADLVEHAKAYAAAGSDARMGGCALPVVINSGSGNQGITLTLPVWVYAEAYGCSKEKLLRALAIANLVSLHQKYYIGSLSAFCGAVCAATGGACGVAWLLGADEKIIAGTIINSINTNGGLVCDGAKSSCAAKIASSVGTALLGMQMSMKQHVFQPGEGLVKKDVEKTIESVGRMGREGMHGTDLEILQIMLEQ